MSAQQTSTKLRLKPIALSIAISTLLPLSVQASVLELYAEGKYTFGTPGLGNPPTFAPVLSGPGYVDALAFPSSGSNQAGIHTYGSVAGDFGSRSSGAGVYDVSGLFRIRESFTNNSSIAQNILFNFNITPGGLGNDLNAGFAAGEFVNAAIKFDIGVNRGSGFVQEWFSQASLRSDTSAIGAFTATGNDTGFYALNPFGGSGGIYYTVSSFSKTLDLGILNPGESLELKYEISSLANGISTGVGGITVPAHDVIIPGYWRWTQTNFYGGGIPGQATNGECFGYGDSLTPSAFVGADPLKPPTDSTCWEFVPEETVTIGAHFRGGGSVNGSTAQSGDPFNFGQAGYYTGILPLQGGLIAAAPEPGTLPLLGLAMGGIWLARRRRYN